MKERTSYLNGVEDNGWKNLALESLTNLMFLYATGSWICQSAHIEGKFRIIILTARITDFG